jgi:hypothetical protein
MAAGSAGARLHDGIGVEAAPRPQADENGGAGYPRRLGELDWIIASVEEEPRQWISGSVARRCGRKAAICSAAITLLFSWGRSRRTRRGAVQLSRAKPTWAIHE